VFPEIPVLENLKVVPTWPMPVNSERGNSIYNHANFNNLITSSNLYLSSKTKGRSYSEDQDSSKNTEDPC
jgi:hypothetical protein